MSPELWTAIGGTIVLLTLGVLRLVLPRINRKPNSDPPKHIAREVYPPGANGSADDSARFAALGSSPQAIDPDATGPAAPMGIAHVSRQIEALHQTLSDHVATKKDMADMEQRLSGEIKPLAKLAEGNRRKINAQALELARLDERTKKEA